LLYLNDTLAYKSAGVSFRIPPGDPMDAYSPLRFSLKISGFPNDTSRSEKIDIIIENQVDRLSSFDRPEELTGIPTLSSTQIRAILLHQQHTLHLGEASRFESVEIQSARKIRRIKADFINACFTGSVDQGLDQSAGNIIYR
jgi:hypothetical protein